MIPKERVLAAINHEPVDRIPCDYWGVPEITEKLKNHFGINQEHKAAPQGDQGEIHGLDSTKSDLELWQTLGIDKILHLPLAPTYRISLTSKYYMGPSFPSDQDIWGNKYIRVPYAEGKATYFEVDEHPLANLDTIAEVEKNYSFPQANWFDFSDLERECRKDQYSVYAVHGGYLAPFYMYNNIRGLGKSLKDLVSNKEYAHYVIGKICNFLHSYQKKILKIAGDSIDLIEVTDDFGTQTDLMISKDTFDEFFRPCYKRLIQLVKDHDIKVFHHDDGAIRKIIPRMVDLGIDILNPIQWRLPGMDPKELKSNFGKNLCFHGAVDNQKTLPFGKPKEVEEEVRMLLDTFASDGTGYILAPCHNIQINTPIENIISMYKTVRD